MLTSANAAAPRPAPALARYRGLPVYAVGEATAAAARAAGFADVRVGDGDAAALVDARGGRRACAACSIWPGASTGRSAHAGVAIDAAHRLSPPSRSTRAAGAARDAALRDGRGGAAPFAARRRAVRARWPRRRGLAPATLRIAAISPAALAAAGDGWARRRPSPPSRPTTRCWSGVALVRSERAREDG